MFWSSIWKAFCQILYNDDIVDILGPFDLTSPKLTVHSHSMLIEEISVCLLIPQANTV